MTLEVLAEGLVFPEGPIALPDGSVILVEIDIGALTRIWQGKREVIAQLGGGPNGAALGPDGAVYVCNNGGGVTPGGSAREITPGRIERVDLASGKFERIYEKVDGHLLSAPNDLVFDAQGNLWFTDFGKTHARHHDRSGIYYARADGSQITEVSYGGTGYNGIGLAPDEKTVYAAETHTGRLMAFDLAAPGQVVKGGKGGRVVASSAHGAFFDSLAVQANGSVCIATIGFGRHGEGGITTISPAGSGVFTRFPDRMVTNLCFGGADLRDAYLTLSGTGQLLRTRWPEAGLKLNFNPY